MGQGLFAHAGAGLGQKFEEAAGAEEVEVGGVEMGGDIDGCGLLAVADPAVFDAGDAFAVEVCGSFGLGSFAEDSGRGRRRWR